MRIIDGNLMFDMSLKEFVGSPTYTKVARRRGIVVPPMNVITEEKPALGYVCNGRWIAHCTGCVGGAEYVWLGGPYQMFCANCGNKDIGYKWRKVIMPSIDVVREIEQLLLKRPDPDNQNWLHNEPIDNLKAENALMLFVGV